MLRTDGGPQFVLAEWTRLMDEYGITHTQSSPYDLQSNGTAESAVKAVVKLLKHHRYGSEEYWKALAATRNAVTEGRGETPAQMVLGQPVRTGTWDHPEPEADLPAPTTRARRRMEEARKGDKEVAKPHFHVGQQVSVQDKDTKL